MVCIFPDHIVCVYVIIPDDAFNFDWFHSHRLRVDHFIFPRWQSLRRVKREFGMAREARTEAPVRAGCWLAATGALN
jgi:hypothetical protein